MLDTAPEIAIRGDQRSQYREVIFSLSIPADDYLRVYQGAAKAVSTLDIYGRRIHFPVNILQPYVKHDGVHGAFAITFDGQNRFKSIERLN